MNRHTIINFTLLLISLIVALLISEIILSILKISPFFYKINISDDGKQYMLSSNKVLIYEPNPNTGENNAYGHRGKAFDVKKNDRKRIVVMGDSEVEGFGIKSQDRFTEILNNKVGDGYEVVNLGVAGYSFLQEVEYFKQKGINFSPDYVIWGICHNDFHSASEVIQKINQEIDKLNRNIYFKYYYKVNNSFEDLLLKLNSYRWLKYLFSSRSNNIDIEEGFPYYKLREVKEISRLLDDLITISQRNNFRQIFIILPSQSKVYHNEVSVFISVLKNKNLDYLDLSYSLNSDPHLFLHPSDPFHLSKSGHEMVAGLIYKKIKCDEAF